MISQIDELHNTKNKNTIYQDGTTTIERHFQLTENEVDDLWHIIQVGFAAVNARSEHRQDMEYEEFISDIQNSNVIKYLARNATNEIVGYLSVHVGLDEIDWAPISMLKTEQAKIDENAEPYYISTFVVPPSMQGLSLGGVLLMGALTDMAEVAEVTGKNGVAFFDCAEVNYPVIPEYAERIAQELTTDSTRYVVSKVHEAYVDDNNKEKQYYYSVTISLH